MLAFALAALTATAGPAAPVARAAPGAAPADLIALWVRAGFDRPRITVWLSRDDPYQRGDDARVYFKSDRDAYVTVVRIDTDGRLRVLFPIDPWEDNFARGGRTFEVLGRDRDEAFRVDDYAGVGYVFAIASTDPFSYDDIIRGDHWDYRAVSDGRVRGDPYVAVSDLADRIAREGDYDYDVASYDVERHYDYPRFVCYDCHAYTSWHYWDPYGSYCSRFRIVIYDDWYYYPYRRYGGVVIVRPYRPGPRYVFKDSDPRNDYITRVAERPRGDLGPRRTIGDRTSADVGGRGAIPVPVSPRRRTGDDGGRAQPGRSPNDTPRRRPGNDTPPNDARPDNTPGRTPGGEPRRRPSNDTPSTDARPDNAPGRTPGGEPRRRPSNDTPPNDARPDRQGGETDQRRPVERQGYEPQRDAPRNEDRPRRRGIEERDNVQRGRPDAVPERSYRPERAPDRRPADRAPDRGSSRPSPSERARPEPRQSPRAEPRSAPRAEPRSAPAPRSTGEPELRRRRP
jgi:hypothetical protein